MKIQYASDLHLEFFENQKWLRKNPLVASAEILLLAGDIALLGDNYSKYEFWDWISDNFEKTYVIPGNHEFYSGIDVANIGRGKILDIRDNIELHYNSLVYLDNLFLVLTPLWSHIFPENAFFVETGLNDFSRIRFENNLLTSETFNQLHYECLDFLKSVKIPNNKKSVIVSHHVPTNLCQFGAYAGSKINNGFVVELQKYIESTNIDFWIYGHSHLNNPEVKIGKTKIICNQLGYTQFEPNIGFCSNICIDV